MPVLDGGNSTRILVINNDADDNHSGDTNDHINIIYMVFQRGRSPNGSDGGGLAVFSVSSLITVAENTFSDNGVGRRGGAARIGTQGGGIVDILNNTFTGNSAGGKAGALSAGTYGQDNLTVSGNTFLNNRAGDGGGGCSWPSI